LRLEKKYDVVFMSNFLEHLNSSDEVLQILECIRPLLNPGGRIIILQPNFALTGSKYFDFIDHKTILTDKSLVEAVELTGFRVEYIKKYFLPYTSKSALPKKPWMVRLYLKLPFLHYLLAGQSIVVAQTLSD
jgi:2-polyprenyl-3-methyl-5-hydroxy-6-metoxy-1,4-benzoquinol methylase